MKTIKERAEWLFATRRDAEVTATEWVAVMGEVLKEIADAPEPEPVADGHVYVHVSGLTGSGKSAVAGEIEIAMRAIGLDVEWVGSESEKRLTHADYTSALELYRPKVRIFEKNISRTAPPAPSVPDAALVRDAAPDIWRVMCGDWREETVAIHNSEGWIADGLDLKKAAALVEAHNGSLGLGVDVIERDKMEGGAA